MGHLVVGQVAVAAASMVATMVAVEVAVALVTRQHPDARSPWMISSAPQIVNTVAAAVVGVREAGCESRESKSFGNNFKNGFHQ